MWARAKQGAQEWAEWEMAQAANPHENKLPSHGDQGPDPPNIPAEEPEGQDMARQEGALGSAAEQPSRPSAKPETHANGLADGDAADGWDSHSADYPIAHNVFAVGGPPPYPRHTPRFHRLRDSRPDIPRQQDATEWPGKPEPRPRFPPNFPPYHCTQSMNEIAAYLANASYVAALGRTPLVDIKYGIIIIPVGEESLLFSRSPDFIINHDFLDAVDDANRAHEWALRKHDSENDSAEFVRYRFDDDFPAVSVSARQGVEPSPLRQGDGKNEPSDTVMEEPPSKGPRRRPLRKSSDMVPDGLLSAQKQSTRPKAGRKSKRDATLTANTLTPQIITKTRRSSRLARRRGNNASSPTTKQAEA